MNSELERKPGENLTDWTLRWLQSREVAPSTTPLPLGTSESERELDRRRLADLERSAGCYDDYDN